MTTQGHEEQRDDQQMAQQPPDAEAVSVREERRISASYSGPVPPPQMMRQYEEMLPGAFERMLSMAERQEAHRQLLERTALLGDSRRANWGLGIGAAIALAGFVLVAYLGSIDQPWVAGIVGALNLGSIVTVFVMGSRERRAERELKRRQMQALERDQADRQP